MIFLAAKSCMMIIFHMGINELNHKSEFNQLKRQTIIQQTLRACIKTLIPWGQDHLKETKTR
jgi:hypothetical protein